MDRCRFLRFLIFFWNRPLILALGKPTFPLLVMIIAGLSKIALSLWLVPLYGMSAQAGLMSAYFIITIGLIVWQGLHQVNIQKASASPL